MTRIPTRRPRFIACLAWLVLLTTQTGCATLFTATTCLATNSKRCGRAIKAAAAIDAIAIDVAAHATANAASSSASHDAPASSYDTCHELVCYDGRCECVDD